MKEKVKFLNKVDYVFEAHQLFGMLASSKADEYTEFKKSVLEKYGSDSKHIRACLALEEEILTDAKETFKAKEEQIKRYFGEIGTDIIPADLLLCQSEVENLEQECLMSAADIYKNYENLSEAVRDACFLKALVQDMEAEEFDGMVGCRERGVTVQEAERIRNIFAYIQKLDIKAESKMQIQELYLNRDAHIKPICELLDEAVLLLQKYDARIQTLCSEWAAYWQEAVETGRFLEMLNSVVELDDDILKKGVCIMPSVVQCASMMVNIYGELMPNHRQNKVVCRVGLVLGEEFNWNSQMREEYCWEGMLPVFKALGDSSKADILLFIKDRAAYGSEIAKKFSLTTATVSHHMNKLVNLRIVQTEMRDGKVYYQARKDAICEMFEQCKKLFE